MAWQATPYAIPSVAAAAVSAALFAYVWRHREEPIARALLLLLAALVAWSLAYAIQLSQTTLGEQLFWQRLGLSIGAAIPTIWLVFAVVYAGYDHRLTPGVVTLLLVDPVAFIGLAWTNDAHGLLWSSARLASGVGLDLAFTPIYLVHITYAYLLVLAGIGLLVAVFFSSSAIYRRQAALLVIGAVVPTVANVAYTFDLGPVPGLDLTTPAFAFTGLVFALGLFRFNFLDLTPVARRRVLDEFGSGLLVADDDGRIVHANETAREVFPSVTIGESVTELLAVDAVEDVDGLVSPVDAGPRRRFHEFSVSALRDFRNRQVGHVIALRDVTTNIEYEQRLEVANRLLRHNLRNDMNKILGWARVARTDAGGRDEALDRIELVARDVADMSRKARRIEASLDVRAGDLETVDVVAVIESVVDDLCEVWPEAEIELSTPASAPVLAPAGGLLTTAFRNVIENAVEHNDREAPHVVVEVAVDVAVDVDADADVDHGADGGAAGRWTAVTVADDGPGIPEMERAVLVSGRETTLEHGSGLGLWLVRWITETAGGELAFAENDPRGSVVTIRLRSA